MTTRPITDRAKQSLFDALTCAVAIADSVVLDCFSGTGSLGLECLSRGAKRVIFVERDRNALDGLRNNIGALRVEQVCDVLSADAYHIGLLLSGKLRGQQLGLAFIDPPYAHMETPEGRKRVDELIGALLTSMAPDALIILRHPTAVTLDDMAIYPRVVRELNYGAMAITWLVAGTLPAS